ILFLLGFQIPSAQIRTDLDQASPLADCDAFCALGSILQRPPSRAGGSPFVTWPQVPGLQAHPPPHQERHPKAAPDQGGPRSPVSPLQLVSTPPQSG
ncbi:hypothetical protein AVEN_133221-1, partial [Araneus ventricosus]